MRTDKKDMRSYCDEMSTICALGYATECERLFGYLPNHRMGDIDLERDVDINNGTVNFKLMGRLGNRINNPVVKIRMLPELAFALALKNSKYEQYMNLLPSVEDVLPLVINKYVTMVLIGIANKTKD